MEMLNNMVDKGPPCETPHCMLIGLDNNDNSDN